MSLTRWLRRRAALLVLDARPPAVAVRILVLSVSIGVAALAVRASVGFALLRAESRATRRYVSVIEMFSAKRHQRLVDLEGENYRLSHLRDRREIVWRTAIRATGLAARRGVRLAESESLEIAEAVVLAAEKHHVAPRLVLGVIMTESSFNRFAVSSKGAMGLMQLMPSTARGLAKELGMTLELPAGLYEPRINVELGTYYLSRLIESEGTIPRALTAYNVGPNSPIELRASFVGQVSRFSGLDL